MREMRGMKGMEFLTPGCDLYSYVAYGQKPFDGKVEVDPAEI